MHRRISTQITLLSLLSCVATVSSADEIRFNRDIRPILSDKCFFCHGPDANHREADLRFDVEEVAKSDLGGYFAIVPGSPGESELVERITSDDGDERMPPPESGKELTDDEIDLLRRWIAEGAEYEPHWSFVSPTRPAVPTVNDESWPNGEIDRFILACLETEDLTPSPPADPVTLVRRLSFDLTGLPPSPDVVDEFVRSSDSHEYDRLVERLLDSREYGERMAMYWLDLVRYANTVGYHGDQEHAIAPYRDWAIKAFRDNMPFDEFTIEQLAGDLLPDPTTDQLIATGYNRVLQTSHEGGVQKGEYLHKYDADRVRNLGGAWMGATLGCCECHDHKFDPYTQHDFYSLVSFFADVDDMRTFNGGNNEMTQREPEIEVLSPLVRDQIEELQNRLAELETDRTTAAATSDSAGTEASSSAATEEIDAELETLRKQIAELESDTQRTMIVEHVEPRTIRVLARGDWMDESGEIVTPAVPQFMGQLDVGDRRATRLDLARWLTSPDNPQTARVFVNRLWYLFFGAGLARSLDDNGAQGEWPDHPHLLDWLAVEFVESGWDVKHMVRLLVTSQTYRQSSHVTPELRERDAENRLLARQGRWRLQAEMIRDNALAVSGLLLEGAPVGVSRPYQPAGYYRPLNFPKRLYKPDRDEDQYRRGVYVHWQRQFLHPMLRAFDAPTREECTSQRPISNTPLAALTLLNDPTFVEASRVFAARIIHEGGSTPSERIRWAWRQALSRDPTENELAAMTNLLEMSQAEYEGNAEAAEDALDVGMAAQPEDIAPAELAAWTIVARGIGNLNEFMTRN